MQPSFAVNQGNGHFFFKCPFIRFVLMLFIVSRISLGMIRTPSCYTKVKTNFLFDIPVSIVQKTIFACLNFTNL